MTLQPHLTHVELTWLEKRIEHWIRFGRIAEEKILDRRRRIVSFAPGGVFAFVRWASNDFGTIISRIDIVRAVAPGEPYATLPFVRPGGEILLRINGWPKVDQVLQAIDAVEASGVDPADAAPDHWRHVHNRLTAGEQPRPYTLARHKAWLMRRECRAMIGRGAMLAVMALGVGATALPQLDDRPPWLIWNASASVPIGLYAVDTIIDVHAGDLVVVRPPEPLARFLADRGYLPRGVPLLKHVAALAGQTVCRIGRSVTVDAIEMGEARERDSRGRALPVWQGCRVIAPGRSLPDEPAVRRLARRTLFRPAARRLDRRPRDPSLGQSNRRGGVIVRVITRICCYYSGRQQGRPFRHLSRILRARFCGPSRLVGSQSSALCYRPRATRVRQRARRPSIW